MRVIGVEAENLELNKIYIHIYVEGYKEALQMSQKLHDLIGSEVDVEVKKHREKRSLNANSYERVLENKLAGALGTSIDEVHNLMLQRYGEYARDKDGNIVWMLLPATEDYSKDPEIHLMPTGKGEERNGMKYYWYAKLMPSHEMNSQQFARLLDGVISECKDADIEVLSEDEIKHMMAGLEKEMASG